MCSLSGRNGIDKNMEAGIRVWKSDYSGLSGVEGLSGSAVKDNFRKLGWGPEHWLRECGCESLKVKNH